MKKWEHYLWKMKWKAQRDTITSQLLGWLLMRHSHDLCESELCLRNSSRLTGQLSMYWWRLCCMYMPASAVCSVRSSAVPGTGSLLSGDLKTPLSSLLLISSGTSSCTICSLSLLPFPRMPRGYNYMVQNIDFLQPQVLEFPTWLPDIYITLHCLVG